MRQWAGLRSTTRGLPRSVGAHKLGTVTSLHGRVGCDHITELGFCLPVSGVRIWLEDVVSHISSDRVWGRQMHRL